jgi:hypothetical protein
MVLAFFLVESMSSTNTFCVAKSLSFPCKLNFHPAIVQRAPGQFFDRYLFAMRCIGVPPDATRLFPQN